MHVYRLMWRQTLFFAHNLIVYVVMLFIFPQHLTGPSLMAIPAFLLLVVNGAWVALLFGILTTRFRDLDADHAERRPAAVLPDADRVDLHDLLNSPNPAIAARARLAEFNPLLHFMEIIRRPHARAAAAAPALDRRPRHHGRRLGGHPGGAAPLPRASSYWV